MRIILKDVGRFWLERLCRPLLMVLAVSVCPSSSFADRGQLEMRVKSAFIYNFTKYITWSDSGKTDTDSNLRICVVKDDEVFELVSETVGGKSTQGRIIEVLHLRDRTEASQCHLAYVLDSRLEEDWRQEMGGAGLVTVGDGGGFVDKGGVFGFVIVNEGVRFEINLAAAEKKGLTISSKLLSLAQRVIY